jgi:uncharacterized protein (TIGR00369 family)
MDLKPDPYRQLPNSRNHNCFGCSPINPSGLQMKFYTSQSAICSDVTVPEHLCGWNNLVHGGVLTTMMDEIMSWAAIYLLKSVPMTKTITVDFLKPVYVGKPLQVQGTVLEKTGKHEVLMEGRIFNEADACCARATGTFAVFSPAVARRLKITDDESLRWFEQIFNLI